jgi:hypothetical protein
MSSGRRLSAGAIAVASSSACFVFGACSSPRDGGSATSVRAGSPSSGGFPAADAGRAGSGGERTNPPANDAGHTSGGTDAPGQPTHQGGTSRGGSDTALPGAAGAPDTNAASAPRTLFYLDVQGKVLSFDEDKPTPRTLVRSAGQGPDGIAIDVSDGYMFWTTMGVPADDDGSLMRASLDGSGVSTIVPTGDTYTPKQLKLDAAAGELYWSDREGMRIQRARVDGSGLQTLVTVASGSAARKDAANWCVGLALDLTHGFVYWTQKGPDNGGRGSIRRAHLELPSGETDANRTDIEVLFAGLPEPVDLDLDVSNSYMYWTDRGDDTINRAPIEIPSGASPATRKDREIIVHGVREAIGVTLDLERGHVYYTGAVNGRVGRANLDGSSAVDLVTGSGALTGISVVPGLGP